MTKGLITLMLIGCTQFVSGQPCPELPKQTRPPILRQIFHRHKEKRIAIEVHKDTIAKYKKNSSGEQIAIADTIQKKKNIIGKGHFNRLIDLQDSTEVYSRKLKLTIYDYALVDGDHITLFKNDEILARTYVKSAKNPIILPIKIKKRKPTIIEMVANNSGYIPPNTAMIEIYDGNTTKKIILFSTIQESGIIKIKYAKTKIKKQPEKFQNPKFS